MDISIDRERLAEEFVRLCEISSPSREEKPVAEYLKKVFGELEVDHSFEDDSALRTGSDSGNLIFRFAGNNDSTPIFFACHMDTVRPGQGVKAERNGDIFTSVGDTILGSDDKSGIAPSNWCLPPVRKLVFKAPKPLITVGCRRNTAMPWIPQELIK